MYYAAKYYVQSKQKGLFFKRALIYVCHTKQRFKREKYMIGNMAQKKCELYTKSKQIMLYISDIIKKKLIAGSFHKPEWSEKKVEDYVDFLRYGRYEVLG